MLFGVLVCWCVGVSLFCCLCGVLVFSCFGVFGVWSFVFGVLVFGVGVSVVGVCCVVLRRFWCLMFGCVLFVTYCVMIVV